MKNIQGGQGIVEYALILVLCAVVIVVILAIAFDSQNDYNKQEELLSNYPTTNQAFKSDLSFCVIEFESKGEDEDSDEREISLINACLQSKGWSFKR